MKLYLMRHGKAASLEQDPERGLTQEGKSEIERLARVLLPQNIHFTHVWHSNKARAKQTAIAITGILSPDAELHVHEHMKPNDHTGVVEGDIKFWTEDSLIVSHLPFLPRLLSLLSGNTGATHAIDFGPGTIVSLVQKKDNEWKIHWVMSPSDIED